MNFHGSFFFILLIALHLTLIKATMKSKVKRASLGNVLQKNTHRLFLAAHLSSLYHKFGRKMNLAQVPLQSLTSVT